MRDSENALQGGSYLTSVGSPTNWTWLVPEHCPDQRRSRPNPLDVGVVCRPRRLRH